MAPGDPCILRHLVCVYYSNLFKSLAISVSFVSREAIPALCLNFLFLKLHSFHLAFLPFFFFFLFSSEEL